MQKLSLMLLCSMFALNTYAQYWHKMPTAEELEYRQKHPKIAPHQRSLNKTTATGIMPSDARFPGEFEELQAVTIGWSYDGLAVDVNGPFANLWAQMATAIQQECPVWIRIDQYSDSTAIKSFMASKGTPLTSYRFLENFCDAFWMRDFGPLAFYYGADDSIGYLDINYYPGRQYDDVYPAYLAGEMNKLHVVSNLFSEGGNYMTDGFGTSFQSSRIQDVNSGPFTHSPQWSVQQTTDTLKYIWASPNLVTTNALNCDGGTAHIDMYLKLMDEQTFAIMDYPASVTASDNAIIDNVITMVSQMTSTYGRNYRIYKVPMPTRNNGTIPTSCGQIDLDARTFVNGVFVNKTYLMPAYSSTSSGNKAGDSAAIEVFKKMLPGYNVVPIDARILTTLGGAIHCVTMQIPAENPIRFWHPSVIDYQPLKSDYHILAQITNRSGIASAECKWRVKGTSSWNTVSLTDSSGYFIGDISGSFAVTDSVEYYLTATSNNGKTMTKPITANQGGSYTFYFQGDGNPNNWPLVAGNIDENQTFILNPLPNPTTGDFYVPLALQKASGVEMMITDVTGKKVNYINYGTLEQGMHKLQSNLADAATGVYFIQVLADGHSLGVKRVVKQ